MANLSNKHSVNDKFVHIHRLMSKIDDEINYLETIVTKKKDQCEKLQRNINKLNEVQVINTISSRPSFQETVKRVYAENKKKVATNERFFDNLGPNIKLPLYNLPHDTLVYHQNLESYKEFKPKLIQFIGRKKERQRRNLEKALREYESNMLDHTKKLNNIEESYEWKMKQAEHRSLFCQVFPELWKQQSAWQNRSTKTVRRKIRPALNDIATYHHSELFVFHNRNKKEMMERHAVVSPFLNKRPCIDLKFLLINNSNRSVVNLSQDMDEGN
ncbi:nuclear receptor corepressor 1-like [Lycorma delicatula]|uniref:nuclear receptor corepressor 1-like n=1 Tax=Lycorma delicatula TaxID=130591 RepID=UPI003F515BD4